MAASLPKSESALKKALADQFGDIRQWRKVNETMFEEAWTNVDVTNVPPLAVTAVRAYYTEQRKKEVAALAKAAEKDEAKAKREAVKQEEDDKREAMFEAARREEGVPPPLDGETVDAIGIPEEALYKGKEKASDTVFPDEASSSRPLPPTPPPTPTRRVQHADTRRPVPSRAVRASRKKKAPVKQEEEEAVVEVATPAVTALAKEMIKREDAATLIMLSFVGGAVTAVILFWVLPRLFTFPPPVTP